ncbi:hypothetical protein VNI00_012460 [Paramarasmius palmivorus]|uniref:DJ-1/PfpI domain-containing protein n=1 Tax=Paramarasmius palmivorus TaxID=297713 RepID=A0AAW0C5Z2_9AGAR
MAVCFTPDVTGLDYQGPVELLAGFSTTARKRFGHLYKNLPDVAIDVEYLSHTLNPVTQTQGPRILPTVTYKDALQQRWDIILIPGGPAANAVDCDPSCLEFIKNKGPDAKHILTVCNGSLLLAGTGLLNGKRATTNKKIFTLMRNQEATKDLPITWVPKARWVVNDDKHIWTSSGVSAGIDLANAFLEYLAGKTFAEEIRGVIELSKRGDEDDEFAEYHGII